MERLCGGANADVARCAQHVLVTLSLALMVLCRSLDQALYYRLSFNYGVYSWFLAFYVLPLGVVLLSWPMVLWKRKATGASPPRPRPCSCLRARSRRMWPAEITPDMLKFPQSKFVVLGGLDAVFAVLSTWPIYHLGCARRRRLLRATPPSHSRAAPGAWSATW